MENFPKITIKNLIFSFGVFAMFIIFANANRKEFVPAIHPLDCHAQNGTHRLALPSAVRPKRNDLITHILT